MNERLLNRLQYGRVNPNTDELTEQEKQLQAYMQSAEYQRRLQETNAAIAAREQERREREAYERKLAESIADRENSMPGIYDNASRRASSGRTPQMTQRVQTSSINPARAVNNWYDSQRSMFPSAYENQIEAGTKYLRTANTDPFAQNTGTKNIVSLEDRKREALGEAGLAQRKRAHVQEYGKTLQQRIEEANTPTWEEAQAAADAMFGDSVAQDAALEKRKQVNDYTQRAIADANAKAYQPEKTLRTDIANDEATRKYEIQNAGKTNAKSILATGAYTPSRFTTNTGEAIANAVAATYGYLDGDSLKDMRISLANAANQFDALAQYATEEEKSVILNLAKDKKWDDIKAYSDALTPKLSARQFDQTEAAMSNAPKAAQVAYGLGSAFTAPVAYGQIALDTARGKYTDLNTGAVGATRLANAARQASLEDAGTVGRFMGNVAYSMADNLISMGLGATGAAVWLGASAAGQDAIETLERGGTQGQAVIKGGVSGAIETATEKLGLDNLFAIAEKTGARGIKAALLDIASQFGSEFSEELISDFAGTFADQAIMGQKSEYDTEVRELMASGLSENEAKTQANIDFFLKNPGLAALAGGISGALFGVGGLTTQKINQNIQRNETAVRIKQANVGDLILREGQALTDNKNLQKQANTIAEAHKDGDTSYSTKELRTIARIYESLSDEAQQRIGEDDYVRTRLRVQEAEQRIKERQEARLAAEQEQQTQRTAADEALAQQEAEAERRAQEAEIDLDNPEALEAEEAPAAQTQQQTEADDLARRAAIADEATRTGDTSVLENVDETPTRETTTEAKPAAEPVQTVQQDEKQQRREYKKTVRGVFDAMGITDETAVGDIADAMQELSRVNQQGGDNADAAKTAAASLFQTATTAIEEDIMRQAQEEADERSREDERVKAARQIIRETKLYVPEDVREVNGESLADFRRHNFGKMQLTRDSRAVSIDQYYDELAGLYPDYFTAGGDGGPINSEDILAAISDWVNADHGGAGMSSAEYAQMQEQASAEAKRRAMEIYRIVADSASQQTTQTQQATQQTETREAPAKETAKPTAAEAAQTTATNARRAGLSDEDALVMSNIAGELGVNLEFKKVKNNRINGYYNHVTRTIVLNQDLTQAEMAWTAFAHEMVHASEEAGSYTKLVDLAKSIVAGDVDKADADRVWRGYIADIRSDYADAGIKTTQKGAEFEAVANTLQDVLGSREKMEGVVRESRAGAEALLESLDKVCDSVTENNTAITPEAARLVQAQKTLAAALDEVREKNTSYMLENVPRARSKFGREYTDQQYKDPFISRYARIIASDVGIESRDTIQKLQDALEDYYYDRKNGKRYKVPVYNKYLDAIKKLLDGYAPHPSSYAASVKSMIYDYIDNPQEAEDNMASMWKSTINDMHEGNSVFTRPSGSATDYSYHVEETGKETGVDAQTIREISDIAEKLKTKVEFRKLAHPTLQGYYNHVTGVIVLSADLTSSQAAWSTFTHEMIHRAQEAGNYNALRELTARLYAYQMGMEDPEQIKNAWDDRIAEIGEWYADITDDEVELDHELVAFFWNEQFENGNVDWNSVVAAYRDGAEALHDVMGNLLDRLGWDPESYGEEDIDDHVSDYIDIQTLAEAHTELGIALKEVSSNDYADRRVHNKDYSYQKNRYSIGVEAPETEASVSGIDVEKMIREAREKYGTMKPGVQYTDEQGNPLTHKEALPNKASDTTATRQTLRSMAETNTLSNMQIRDLALLDQYTPTSDEKNVAKAKKLRGTDSLDAAYYKWKGMFQRGSWTSGDWAGKIAFAELLMNEANKKAQETGESTYVDMALEIAGDIAYIGTEAGQTVQALSLIKKMTPEGQLQSVQRMAEDYETHHGGERNVPKDVQTVMDTVKVNEELLNKLEELNKLKKLEANGGKLTEKEAQRIADIEKEIDRLNEKLEPLRKKLAKLAAERAEDAKEAGKLKREEKSLPRQIERVQSEIDDLQKTIDELNETLGPKRGKLLFELSQEGLKRAERNKLAHELSEVNKQIRNAKSRIARAQATILSITNQMSVKGATLAELQEYERVLKSSREIMDTYLRYTENKGGGVKIPDDLRKAFIKAKTEEERDTVRVQINQAIADQLPGTRAEKMRAWRYMSMLANPTTHLRNIAGNSMQYAEKGFRDTLAAGLEAVAMRKNAALYQEASERAARYEQSIRDLDADTSLSDADKAPMYESYNKSLKEAREDMRRNERSKAVASRFSKADKAYYDAAREDYKIIKKDLQAGGRASETEDIDKARQIFDIKALDKARKFAMNLLETEDEWFLRANYTQSFAEYLKANKLDPANMSESQLQRARARSFKEALEATYRDASAIADLIGRIEKQNMAAEFFVGGIMPFKKTPINILKRGVEYSPLGLLRAAVDTIQMQRGKSTKTKTDILAEFSEGMTGSLLAGLGYIAANMGIAAATGDDDEKDRKKALDKETGSQNYSIKFKSLVSDNEYTYTFDWLMPGAMSFFSGVRLREAMREFGRGELTAGAIVDSIFSLANPIFELSMLDGVASLFKNYASDDAGIAWALAFTALQSLALQYLPTFGGKLARVIDPYQRSTYSPKDAKFTKQFERLYRRSLAKIPGASYALEEAIDRKGEIKENFGGNVLSRAVYQMVSPGYVSKVTHEDTDEEIKRLYAAMQEIKPNKATSVLPKETPTYYELNGEKYYLDATEYKRVAEKLGQLTYSGLDELFQSDEYKQANTIMQAKMVGDVMDEASEQAKRMFYEDIGVLEDYLRTKLDPLLYDDSTGERVYRNIEEVRKLYEDGYLDLKTVEAGSSELSHISKMGDKLEALNAMNLSQDEYNFLYMTKIAGKGMQSDMQAILDAGGSLTDAIKVVSKFYKWDDSIIDEETGKFGVWVKKDKGSMATLLADSKLPDEAVEAFYLNFGSLVPSNMVEKEQAKIDDYTSRGLTVRDYLRSLDYKYDETGEAYEGDGGKYKEILESDADDKVKEAAVINLVCDTDDAKKTAKEDIAAFKTGGYGVNEYLATRAALYDENGKAIEKTGEKATALANSDIPAKAKGIAWYTVVSDAKGAKDMLNTFCTGGNTVNDFLRAVAATSKDGMTAPTKSKAILDLPLKSYTAAIKSIVTTSENKIEGIDSLLRAGISDRTVAYGYAKYAEINARDDLNGSGKATEFSKWLDTDSTMSKLSADDKALMKDVFSYYNMVRADAGRYDNLMKINNMTSAVADSISSDIAALKPLEGAKTVSDAQKIGAIAVNKTATDAQKDSAIGQIFDSSDDGQEAAKLTAYKGIRNSGVSIKTFADFYSATSVMKSDKDANGKDIKGRSRQDKIWAYINSLPISRDQKDKMHCFYYKDTTLKKTPWH